MHDAAIVGVGNTDFGRLYREADDERDAYSLAADAFAEALSDSGLDKSQVDGLICSRVSSYTRMGDMLGIRYPKIIHGLPAAGRFSGLALQMAVMAIQTGQASVVACVYGNDGRSQGAKYGGGTDPNDVAAYDQSFGMTSPGAYVSMMYRNYQHRYGAPEDALAPVAISNRQWAQLNPHAVMQKSLTTEDYLRSKFIAEPMRLYDYCLINDGGVAFIVARADIARDLPKPPAYVSAMATSGSLTNFYTSPDYFGEACRSVADRLQNDSGMSPQDVDCFQIYDNFTPVVLFSMEGFGMASPGEAWQLVRDGRTGPGGSTPVNTSGGHTSESYMQGWAMHVEAVRQIRGEAGPRQVPDCRSVQYICASPIVSSHIFTSEPLS